jgi:hypothetical protein
MIHTLIIQDKLNGTFYQTVKEFKIIWNNHPLLRILRWAKMLDILKVVNNIQ